MIRLIRQRREGLQSAIFSDKRAVEAFLARTPVDSVLARAALREVGIGGNRAQIYRNAHGEITGYCWDYGNLIPLGFSQEQLDEVAGHLLSKWRTASSLVGPQDQVMGLWRRLESEWGVARSVRERQFSMTMGPHAKVRADPTVRPTTVRDFPLVFPTSVAMYKEEVGYDPTTHGRSYEQRARSLAASGHTFIKLAPSLDGRGERVIFKADVGALAGGVAQVQGVWVAPDMRGRGIARAGMAAVVNLIRSTIAPTVSLYVNDYNEAAVAVYKAVGFTVQNFWATVLI